MKILKYGLGIFVLLFVVGLFAPDTRKPDTQKPTATQSSESVEPKWYQDGTLHDATVGDWKAATHRNRLATASDWTTAVIGEAEFARLGLNGVKEKAEELVKCINGSTEGLDVNGMSSREIGAACIVLLEWK